MWLVRSSAEALPRPTNLEFTERIVSVLYCGSPDGTRGPMVRDLCPAHHWILVSQNSRHLSSTQLASAAWMIACLVQFSISALLGQECCASLHTSSS